MKLSEIYQTPDDTWVSLEDEGEFMDLSPNASNQIYAHRQHPKHVYLGAGSYAYVGTNDDENFGDVHRISNADDGGSMYLKYLVDHPEIMDNPFFPKVREVAQRSPASKRNFQTTIVERLVPYDTKSIINNSLLTTAIWNRYVNITQNVASRKFYDLKGMAALPYIIAEAVNSGDVRYIKDPRLIEAVHILNKIRDMLDAETDIHAGNIMWRMAPYQPQLVITDPFVA